MDVRLLLVPYDSGQRGVRMGAGPERLCEDGLKKHLVRQGHSVDEQTIEPVSSGWRAEVQTSFELMRAVAEHVRAARGAGRFPLVLSGNCNAAIGAIGGLGAGTGVIWLDAHGDFNTPQTTTSGFFDGMTLATVTGRCWVEMARRIEGFEPVPDQDVVLIGAHDLDPGEEVALARSKIVRLNVKNALAEIEPILETLAQTTKKIYLHLDLDALDAAEGRANSFAVPNGFSRQNLEALVATAARLVPIEAMTIASYDPTFDPEKTVRDLAMQSASLVLDNESRKARI